DLGELRLDEVVARDGEAERIAQLGDGAERGPPEADLLAAGSRAAFAQGEGVVLRGALRLVGELGVALADEDDHGLQLGNELDRDFEGDEGHGGLLWVAGWFPPPLRNEPCRAR